MMSKVNRFILLIAVILILGCTTEEKKEDCDEGKCTVELPKQAPKPVCGDGKLQGAETCEVGNPCKDGYCSRCQCLQPTPEDIVTDCKSHCESIGFTNSSLVDDGECNPYWGASEPCTFKCSTYRVFPTVESDKVCCCRNQITIECPMESFSKDCKCPDAKLAKEICAKNTPKIE